jgi:hypothetical protein
MNHSHNQGPKAEVQPCRVFIQLSVVMQVPVRMRGVTRHVGMSVTVKMKLFLPEVIENAGPQGNEHDRNAHFEPARETGRDFQLEKKDETADYGEGEGVAGSPEEADPATSEEVSFPADKSGDGRNMIGVRGMLQAEKETQTQNSRD